MVQSHLSHWGRSKASYFTFYRWRNFKDFNPRSSAVSSQIVEDQAQKYYSRIRQISLCPLTEPSWPLGSQEDNGICIVLRVQDPDWAGEYEAGDTTFPHSLYHGKGQLKCISKHSSIPLYLRKLIQFHATLCSRHFAEV